MDRYRQACAHADATIDALSLGALGRVPWWPKPRVNLFNVTIHVLTETNRHAGHAEIFREQIDGQVGSNADSVTSERGTALWASHRAKIEKAAQSTQHNQINRDDGSPTPSSEDQG